MAKAYVAISEVIWCDPKIRSLSDSAALRYVFLIANSKVTGQDGKTDLFSVKMCGGSEADVEELSKVGLLIPLPDGKFDIAKYTKWQLTSDEIVARSMARSQAGKTGANKRWGKETELPAAGAHPDADAWFEAAWAEWPEASESRYNEKRTEALAAFRAAILTQEEYDAFVAALQARLHSYRSDTRSKHEKRQYLGAFKNFCGKWQDHIPKGYGSVKPASASSSVADGYDPTEDKSDPFHLSPEELQVMKGES
jgi:hypothetical protein